jgi:flagellar protein FliS
MNPYASAQRAYTESAVLTAPPERLILMLYDGAIRFLSQGAVALRRNDIPQARERVRRAEAIIDELNWSLDMSHGEVPERLRAIYLFCKRHLIEATIQKDPDRIATVQRLLGELREAWEQIATAPAAGKAA